MRSTKLRLASVIMLMLAVCICLPMTALAAGGKLTLNYAYNSVEFQIYRVTDSRYELTGAFAEYSVKIPVTDSSSDWKAAADTLAAYAKSDNITPTAKGTTANGSVSFSGLEAGIYLVTGDTCSIGGYTYTPSPFLISVSDSGSVTANVKYDQSGGGGGDSYSSYTVKKVWSGDTEAERPESVTVQLLRNGSVYETVTLDGSNGWSYTWNSLNDSYQYQITEVNVPDGYTVSVSQSGTIFTVTNSLIGGGEPTEPKDPDDPDEPTDPDTPTNPDEPTNPDAPSTPDEPSLPQTGQFWWPVVLLLGAGIVLLLIDSRKDREDSQDNGE